jgi:hypothetical protein
MTKDFKILDRPKIKRKNGMVITYIGMWVTGFGFFDVRFPKETTRELTKEEIKQIDMSEVK